MLFAQLLNYKVKINIYHTGLNVTLVSFKLWSKHGNFLDLIKKDLQRKQLFTTKIERLT